MRIPPPPRPFRSAVLAAARVGAVLALTASGASADPVEYLPPAHWAYDDLLALWNRGVVDSLNVASRPWSRIEIARALGHVEDADRNDPLVRRLEWQFARELERIGKPGRAETSPLLRLREGESELRLTAGAEGRVSGAPASDARIQPGSGGFLRARAYLQPHGFLITDLRLQRTGSDRDIGDAVIKNEDLYLDTGETYVTVSPAGFELLFGLAETRWGPGRSGTLLISDAPDPFAVLRLRRTFGGRLELDTMHGTLVQTDNRHVAMHRLSVRVSGTLTLGFAESARYDAPAPELLYLLNLVPYSLLERFSQKHRALEPGMDQRNNVMMAGDVVWRFRRDARLWAELLLDDVATELGYQPHRMAWQAGVAISTRLGRIPFDVGLEHTKVFRFTYSVAYDRNYIFSGRPLGYADGPDVERWTLRLKADPAAEWSLAMDADLLRRGEGFLGESWDTTTRMDPWSGLSLTGVVESTLRAVPSVAWIPRDNVRLAAGVGVRHARNAGNVRGRTRTDPEAFLEMMVHK